VERVVYELPQVQVAAVIGVPDAYSGERPVVVVVVKAGQALALEALQAHCRRKLAGFKVPKQLIVHTDLPRNPSGESACCSRRSAATCKPPRAEARHELDWPAPGNRTPAGETFLR
jgi:acyl-CoA synthetase (AMP-forming)/AMP-acid ligase II